MLLVKILTEIQMHILEVIGLIQQPFLRELQHLQQVGKDLLIQQVLYQLLLIQ